VIKKPPLEIGCMVLHWGWVKGGRKVKMCGGKLYIWMETKVVKKLFNNIVINIFNS